MVLSFQHVMSKRTLLFCVLPDVYFTVGLFVHGTFLNNEIIKFNRVINNIRGGYIDDVINADYGKFIAPHNGTYQFNANLFSNGKLIGGDLMKNGERIIAMKTELMAVPLSAALWTWQREMKCICWEVPGQMPVPVMNRISIVFPDFSFKNRKL